MYECPNCNGNLKFDIVRQKLFCEYCGTEVDPYSFQRERDAVETESPSGEYEVTVFTCPQCGAEILSEDTTAATFCSFCGGSAILDSRIRKERRPAYIIPFTKTKEDCRRAYKKMLRRAIFAPKELKDEAHIEKFRGIYMPYWVYSFEEKGVVSFPGEKSHSKINGRVIDHYRLVCDVEENYKGLAYDASSTFSDSLSGAIAPFDLKKGKAFAPAFLSGFYADTNDVGRSVYLEEAKEVVIEDASRYLARDPLCKKYHANKDDGLISLQNSLRPSKSTAELAMLPVWFLSYRNGDRVSYAVVNGQTGKAAADLPVDPKRYLMGSFFLAVPFYFLLNMLFTFTPGNLLVAAIVLALLSIWISNGQLNHVLSRESGRDDRGLASLIPWGWPNRPENRRDRQTPTAWHTFGVVMAMMAVFYSTAFLPSLFLRMAKAGQSRIFTWVFMIFMVSLIFLFAGRFSRGRRAGGERSFGGGHWKEKWPVLIKPLVGIVVAAFILILNPASDLFYYTGALVCMGTVLCAIMDIMRQHNRLTMRKLPQLNRRGGDERE